MITDMVSARPTGCSSTCRPPLGRCVIGWMADLREDAKCSIVPGVGAVDAITPGDR
jgi:hypothetical protein